MFQLNFEQNLPNKIWYVGITKNQKLVPKGTTLD
jgi:hypothetical protein